MENLLTGTQLILVVHTYYLEALDDTHASAYTGIRVGYTCLSVYLSGMRPSAWNYPATAPVVVFAPIWPGGADPTPRDTAALKRLTRRYLEVTDGARQACLALGTSDLVLFLEPDDRLWYTSREDALQRFDEVSGAGIIECLMESTVPHIKAETEPLIGLWAIILSASEAGSGYSALVFRAVVKTGWTCLSPAMGDAVTVTGADLQSP